MRISRRHPFRGIAAFLSGLVLAASVRAGWERHAIDPGTRDLRGADGVRFGDVNGDGLPDVVTGWEQGRAVRICLNPGPARCRDPWPAVTVGRVPDAEDAVFTDIKGDGVPEVLSCTEGGTRALFLHYLVRSGAPLEVEASWATTALSGIGARRQWMFAEPLDRIPAGVRLAVGSKGGNGAIGLLDVRSSVAGPGSAGFLHLREAGWIMSLIVRDFDADGDPDILYTDRKGARRGVGFLENPGPAASVRSEAWREHVLGGTDREVMFADVLAGGAAGEFAVAVATRDGVILLFEAVRLGRPFAAPREIPNPFGVRHGKAVRFADLNRDGITDLLHTANTQAEPGKPGVAALYGSGPGFDFDPLPADVSGLDGAKFDLIRVLDCDADGDLDAVTCEEVDNLGVFWYENPSVSPAD